MAVCREVQPCSRFFSKLSCRLQAEFSMNFSPQIPGMWLVQEDENRAEMGNVTCGRRDSHSLTVLFSCGRFAAFPCFWGFGFFCLCRFCSWGRLWTLQIPGSHHHPWEWISCHTGLLFWYINAGSFLHPNCWAGLWNHLCFQRSWYLNWYFSFNVSISSFHCHLLQIYRKGCLCLIRIIKADKITLKFLLLCDCCSSIRDFLGGGSAWAGPAPTQNLPWCAQGLEWALLMPQKKLQIAFQNRLLSTFGVNSLICHTLTQRESVWNSIPHNFFGLLHTKITFSGGVNYNFIAMDSVFQH